jgi:hypothetical protein
MGRRARSVEEYRVSGVIERLAPYDVALVDDVSYPDAVDGDLVERAATLLQLMPRNQRRETIEDLVCPNDQQRGRRAVAALIDAAFAAEDGTGRLRLVCAEDEEHSTEPQSTFLSDTLAEARNASLEPRDEEEERAPGWRRRASRLARRVVGPTR